MAIAANLRAAITVVGPLADDVAADLALSAAQVSLLVSMPLVCFGAFALVAPRLTARWGVETTSVVALAALAVGVVARSAPWVPALWGGTLLVGAGIATLNVALPAMVKRDFPAHVGRMTGVYSATQSTFAAVAAVVAVPLAGVHPSGWRLAFGVWAGLALVAIGLVAPQLRGARRPDARAAAAVPPAWRPPWRSALGWQVACYMGLQSTFYYSVITWWPSVEADGGVGAGAAGAHQGVLQVVGIVASLVAGRLIDRSRPRGQSRLVVVFSSLSTLAVVGQLVAPGWWAAWIMLLGAGTAAVFVTGLSFFGLRAEHHAQAAALSGMAQAFGYGLAALGPVTIGALHDVTQGWTWPLLALLALKVPEVACGVLAGRARVVG
ncbi:MFS transporter [Xylanimonas ulmi]|uniref:CP family cyanate transporter-like MFS transporter n=1 Tax=Xylanimonas ulmi TaxID=228973 RepID=A0A4V2EXP6_9MICO|nr:MFS transporter [Xylanibacterium ulmi]RZS60220.1 CP family cyanate transporter-like MFS transporter [Xylanibacterium ulmi]